ncbi:positive regulation of ruffle assembly [Sparganum proliferum]
MSFGQSICSVCRKPCPQPHQHLCAVCFVCWNAVHRACLQPAVDADQQNSAEIEEAVARLVSDPQDGLCREDVIEVFVPVLRVTCQNCANPSADASLTC